MVRGLLLGIPLTLLFSAGASVATLDVPAGELGTTLQRTAAASSLPSVPEGAEFEMLQAAYGPSPFRRPSPSLSALQISSETVWLARVIFSETKRPHEQELVAWVVRNRVDTQYRGKETYKEVVLDPYQFSAFNPERASRAFLLALTPDVSLPHWQQSLWIAHYVRNASPALRPFSIETRHFYSERSLAQPRPPPWIEQTHFVSSSVLNRVDEHRFRFYKAIS